VVTEAGSYLRHIDFCITQLKAQGPSRTCNESKEEEEEVGCRDHDEGAVSILQHFLIDLHRGLEIRVQSLGFKAQGLGFGVYGVGFRISRQRGSAFTPTGLGCRVCG